MSLLRKCFVNKTNKQISITLPKKNKLFRKFDGKPKKVKIKIEEVIW